ncbi:MAG: GNAT family N-acetyltransferase [Eubacteriales bacterium]|nr:GNAT family N-acetyltransferase [Eubacteriales bacterium]
MENNALTLAQDGELDTAVRLIDEAKAHLKELGVNQWQTGYPDRTCIRQDIERSRGYFLTDGSAPLAYLCIDFDGEPAYDHLQGEWERQPPYAVVHRLAVGEAYRGRGLASEAFRLTEALCRARGVRSIRVDTDEDNAAMKHILTRNGFAFRGTIWFDNSVKIAYEKTIG